jgi:hypothetical protein
MFRKYDNEASIYEKRADNFVSLDILSDEMQYNTKENNDKKTNTIIIISAVSICCLFIIIGLLIFYKLK